MSDDDELARQERELDRVENSLVFDEARREGIDPYEAAVRAARRRTAGPVGPRRPGQGELASDETVGDHVDRLRRRGTASLYIAPWPPDNNGWRALGQIDDPVTIGWSRYEDEIELHSADDGYTVPFAREYTEVPLQPPLAPPPRLTRWARVKDTVRCAAVVLGWLLFLAYLTWVTMPQPVPVP